MAGVSEKLKNLPLQDRTKLASNFGGAKSQKVGLRRVLPLGLGHPRPTVGAWAFLSETFWLFTGRRLTKQTRRQYGPKEKQQKDCDLYRGSFTQYSYQQILHRKGLLRRHPSIERGFSTEQLLQRDPFYTNTELLNKHLLRRAPFTQRPIFTETL